MLLNHLNHTAMFDNRFSMPQVTYTEYILQVFAKQHGNIGMDFLIYKFLNCSQNIHKFLRFHLFEEKNLRFKNTR